MKKLFSIGAVLALLILPFSKSNAYPPGSSSVTAFWLDVNVVNQIAASGAVTLKIYAGMDQSGNFCYYMVGGDAGYNTIGDNVFMQKSSGVCPPQCDFTSVNLGEGTNANVSGAQATEAINAYMSSFAGVKNCARFTMSSLSTLRSSSAYLKVSIGTSATAAGLKSDGTVSGKSNVLGTAAMTGL